ncbi:MAG: hypothetical protein HOP11_09520 [Saprospiraceae bacterium]|nr:hypothetical protein [Saprospiraceae bacterium]
MIFTSSAAIAGINAPNGDAVPVIDIHAREYSAPYFKNIVVDIDKATQRSFNISDLDFFKDIMIIGVVTRGQNAAGNRKTRTGALIISEELMGSAFVKFSQGHAQVIDSIPLEHLVHDFKTQGPLKYAQIMLEYGITAQSSSIEFSVDPGVDDVGKAVELGFIYVPTKAFICK